MFILLMVFCGYSIVIILMTIGDCFTNGYWWLLIDIILMAIGGYFINGYWWLFCYKPLVVIDVILWMVVVL